MNHQDAWEYQKRKGAEVERYVEKMARAYGIEFTDTLKAFGYNLFVAGQQDANNSADGKRRQLLDALMALGPLLPEDHEIEGKVYRFVPPDPHMYLRALNNGVKKAMEILKS